MHCCATCFALDKSTPLIVHCSEKFCSWYIWWKNEILLCVPLMMQQETRNSDWSASAEEGKTWVDRWREICYKEKVTDHSFNMEKKNILHVSPFKQPPFLFSVFRIKIHSLSTESIRAWQNQSLQPTNAKLVTVEKDPVFLQLIDSKATQGFRQNQFDNISILVCQEFPEEKW